MRRDLPKAQIDQMAGLVLTRITSGWFVAALDLGLPRSEEPCCVSCAIEIAEACTTKLADEQGEPPLNEQD